jgi:hypothetical protein
MGLQDLLAVVLGVKTAEALQQRKTAKQDAAFVMSQAALRRYVSPEFAAAEFQTTYEQIEDVINDDLGRALNSGSNPEEAVVVWAAMARPKLRGYASNMRMCLGWDPRTDAVIERIRVALGAYDVATKNLIERQPEGRDLLERAASEWHGVQKLVTTLTGY